MKRQLFFGTLLATALSVGLSAQTPQSPTSTPSTPQTPTSTAEKPSRAKQDVTLTGCLQSGSGASTTATTGTAASGSQKSGSAMSGGQFILANAKMSGSSGSTATGTAGSPSSAATASAADSYKLVGHENDLRKYANSQVEVKGTIESKASSGATPSASASSASSEPTLRVSSVKQVSPSCSEGK
jgi:hypothetical protein